MGLFPARTQLSLRQRRQLVAAISVLWLLSACVMLQPQESGTFGRLRATVGLVAQVKAFGKTLGIEPTESLRRTAGDDSPLSMLWLWLQREGTLALGRAIDIRMAIGFNADKERVSLERIYRVEGYSVYHRQGNEFADPRALTTVAFAGEEIVRRVKVILHEDLHGDQNFALPWELEESIVTPLGALAAVEFFRHTEDHENLRRALDSLEEERRLSRELKALATEAERLFATAPLEEAKKNILRLLPSYPVYFRQFQRQLAGQNAVTALEAKLSHDLAYFREFDSIAFLAEKTPDLATLIKDLKKLPYNAGHHELDYYLQELNRKYNGSGA